MCFSWREETLASTYRKKIAAGDKSRMEGPVHFSPAGIDKGEALHIVDDTVHQIQ